jgi:ATP-binding cassette, subfamily B, multidrug efflux pump
MKSLSYLNKYFFKYKWQLLLGILFTFGLNYLYVQMPIIVGSAVDTLEDNFNPKNWLNIALTLGGIYIAFSLGKGILLFFQRQMIIKMSRYMEFDLKNEIYAHYQRLSYSFYKKNSTGDLMNRISEDVSQVRMYLGPGVMYTINLIILFAFVLYFMLNINVELTLYVLAPLPIMSFLIYKVSSRMNKQSADVQRQQSGISTIVQESFSGITVLKAYGGEPRFAEQFNNASDNYLKKQMNLVKTNALFMPTITFLIGLSTVITIYLGGILSAEAHSTLTSGNILTFIFYVNMLTWPFASVGWVTSLVQRAAASQERINEFLREQPEIKNPTENPFEFKGKISFKNVSYTYPNSGIQAIKNLSFTAEKGQTIAFLGRTGSGKSSVINLVMRQFDPTSGEICIDDQPLTAINVENFRNQTGVVPQEVFLFSDSIRNNIKFGLNDGEDRTDDELNDIMKVGHVYHNVVDFPMGLDTLLGERGVNLSGGQKQRLSICRALIRHPKFLILDDCLSAVDTETEEIILTNLKEQIKENTTLIVSHRVSSIRYADKIIVLEDGEKIEEGSHEELLSKKGVYYDIYQKQLLEGEEKEGEHFEKED